MCGDKMNKKKKPVMIVFDEEELSYLKNLALYRLSRHSFSSFVRECIVDYVMRNFVSSDGSTGLTISDVIELESKIADRLCHGKDNYKYLAEKQRDEK